MTDEIFLRNKLASATSYAGLGRALESYTFGFSDQKRSAAAVMIITKRGHPLADQITRIFGKPNLALGAAEERCAYARKVFNFCFILDG